MTGISSPVWLQIYCRHAEMVCEFVGFQGEIVYDASKPDGTPRKLVDGSKINGLGWQAKTGQRERVENTYRWFLDNVENLRGL